MAYISLSDGEWKLMKLLWAAEPRTLGELVHELESDTGWNKSTVFMMLKRLIVKGAVRMEDGGKMHEYYPLITRREVTPVETDSFLARVYDGSVSMMVSSLAGRQALSEEEIAQLKQIIEAAEKKGGK